MFNQIYIHAKVPKCMKTPQLIGAQPSPFKGFLIRFLALIVDAVLLGIAVWVSAIVFGIFFESLFGGGTGILTFFLVLFIASFATLLYKPIMEASEYQGTFGKYFLNMKVVDKNGRKIIGFYWHEALLKSYFLEWKNEISKKLEQIERTCW